MAEQKKLSGTQVQLILIKDAEIGRARQNFRQTSKRTNVREHFEENFSAAIWCFPSNFKRWSSAGTRHFSLKT